MTLLQGARAVGLKCTVPFQAINGTAPYAYAVISGGVGGSISSDGVYTAPNRVGVDVVRVTDSLNVRAVATIDVGTPLELICDIIKTEMDLTTGQVYVYNQKYTVPNDSRLYVAVGVLSCKAFSNTGRFGDQATNFSALVTIDIMSKSTEARDRKEELVLALGSQYAEQQQELNGFRIFQLPAQLLNISEQEGPAILNRFSTTVNIQYFVTKTKAVPYFDTFEEIEIATDP